MLRRDGTILVVWWRFGFGPRSLVFKSGWTRVAGSLWFRRFGTDA